MLAFCKYVSPEEVFDAINNVRGWWSGEVEGETDKLRAEFTYRVPNVHYCKMKITEFIPGKKVVWHVLDSYINYTDAKTEWKDNEITFEITEIDGATEIRFKQIGLVPAYECYNSCSGAWGKPINSNLSKLISTGNDQPNLFAANN